MKLRAVLLDAKKAAGAFAVMAPQAAAVGLISGATAGLIAGVATVVTTGIVYALDNIPKPSKAAVNVTVHGVDVGQVGRHVAAVLADPKPKQ